MALHLNMHVQGVRDALARLTQLHLLERKKRVGVPWQYRLRPSWDWLPLRKNKRGSKTEGSGKTGGDPSGKTTVDPSRKTRGKGTPSEGTPSEGTPFKGTARERWKIMEDIASVDERIGELRRTGGEPFKDTHGNIRYDEKPTERTKAILEKLKKDKDRLKDEFDRS